MGWCCSYYFIFIEFLNELTGEYFFLHLAEVYNMKVQLNMEVWPKKVTSPQCYSRIPITTFFYKYSFKSASIFSFSYLPILSPTLLNLNALPLFKQSIPL